MNFDITLTITITVTVSALIAVGCGVWHARSVVKRNPNLSDRDLLRPGYGDPLSPGYGDPLR
jgi:hypothetical protein